MTLGAYQLFPPAMQVARILARPILEHGSESKLFRAPCSWLSSPSTFRRGYSPTGTWQHRKQQHSHRSLYHDPVYAARMTGGTVNIPTLSPSAITPLPLWSLPDTTFKECHVRLYSTKPPSQPSSPVDENQNETQISKSSHTKVSSSFESGEAKEEKMTLVQKFKLMFKQYWYVLVPVHAVTSVVWYGSFFLAAKSGVDIVPWLEWIGASEKILSHLRNSNAGYYAIAYAMYKIATPARYTVTIGGTTISINYLKKRGYIKPVPSSEQLKEMYEGKREEFIEKRDEMKERYHEKKDEMKERYHEKREEIIEKYEKYQEKKEDIIERVSERREELKDRVAEKREELKEKVAEKREEGKEKLGNLKKKVFKGS